MVRGTRERRGSKEDVVYRNKGCPKHTLPKNEKIAVKMQLKSHANVDLYRKEIQLGTRPSLGAELHNAE